MKTFNMVLKLILMSAMTATIMACSEKGGKSATLRGGSRQGVPGTPGGQASGVPSTSLQQNQNCSNCGYIYNNQNSNWSQELANFLLIDQDQLGSVDNRQGGSNTGVFFRGQVDGNAQSGNMDIIVWDSRANAEGVYVASFQLNAQKSDRPDNNGGTFRLVFEDSLGEVYLTGRFSEGLYFGQVSYTTQGGQTRALGEFVTGDFSFVR